MLLLLLLRLLAAAAPVITGSPPRGAGYVATGGWFEDLPANVDPTARHQVGVTPCGLPRDGWARAWDNQHVVALRECLRENNGIAGLEICAPHEVERATQIFHRDGFVAVRDALRSAYYAGCIQQRGYVHACMCVCTRVRCERAWARETVCGGARACDRSPLQLERMRATTDRAMLAAIESGPPAELRYSIGGSSASRQWLHDPAYCELLDLPTTSPILRAIFGSGDYQVGGAGGDAAMPVRAFLHIPRTLTYRQFSINPEL